MRLHGRTVPALLVAVVAMLLVAGCGAAAKGTNPSSSTAPATQPAGGGTSDTVTIQNFAFTPQTLTVKVGTKVTWTNKDSAQHNVMSADSMATNAKLTGTFNSGTLDQGQSYSFTFTKAGTYYYECSIHFTMAAMHARIVVK